MRVVRARSEIQRLPLAAWQVSRLRHRERVRPWAEARLQRQSRHEKHPVHDFLFEYYSFSPAKLLRWSPGPDVLLEGARLEDVGTGAFHSTDEGLLLPSESFPLHRQDYLRWAVAYLQSTMEREPFFGCFGLHEWAMVYNDPKVRHPQLPLRLTREETDAVVESHPLHCTHFDAFRFFTRAAVPRNRIPLSRADTVEHDQAGCIHVNMDLYRFAFKIGAFCPSDLLADAFEFALAAREVDMRASPYDLSGFGCEPILIETRAGREEYVELQREIARKSQPLRERLLAVYLALINPNVTDPSNESGRCG